MASIGRGLPLPLVANQEAYFRTGAPRGRNQGVHLYVVRWGGMLRGPGDGRWSRTLRAERVEEWEKWGPHRALLSCLQGLSSTGLFSVETWPGWSRGGSEETTPPPTQGLSASCQSGLSPLCSPVRRCPSTSPPTSKTPDRPESRREAECAKCSRGNGCSEIRNAVEYFRMIPAHLYDAVLNGHARVTSRNTTLLPSLCCW